MINKRFTGPWARRLFLKRISLSVIIVSASLSLVITGLSIYGNNVGNFVFNIEQETRTSLSLSESGDFLNGATTVLQTPGLSNSTHATYSDIPDEIWKLPGGGHNDFDHRYIAYNFFLKNTSPGAVSYTVEIKIEKQFLNVAAAMRVMVISGQNGVVTRTIYAQRDKDGNVVSHPDIDKPYETKPFTSVDRVCYETNPFIAKDEIIKYTLVLWLEGWDPECTDDIKGGAIRMSMNFTAI